MREYLTRHIVHELEARDYEGMELFFRYARELAEAGRLNAPMFAEEGEEGEEGDLTALPPISYTE